MEKIRQDLLNLIEAEESSRNRDVIDIDLATLWYQVRDDQIDLIDALIEFYRLTSWENPEAAAENFLNKYVFVNVKVAL